jgi:hypothetical protein
MNQFNLKSEILPICIAVVGIISTFYFYESDLGSHAPFAPIAGAFSLLLVAIVSGLVIFRKAGNNSNKLLKGMNLFLFMGSIIGATYVWYFIT